MREIEFRGKSISDNIWLFGDLIGSKDEKAIYNHNNILKVKTETVGQFTGLLDKNNKKIYENDIVELELQNFYSPERLSIISKNEKFIYKVIFKNGCFGLESKIKRFTSFDGFCNAKFEVIGNIYDNLELIGE